MNPLLLLYSSLIVIIIWTPIALWKIEEYGFELTMGLLNILLIVIILNLIL